uniref:Uncharacterized protein n=1 Tax=Arundo donax TaxID=35708 RepID=A0A0A8YPJ8_ARUDO
MICQDCYFYTVPDKVVCSGSDLSQENLIKFC